MIHENNIDGMSTDTPEPPEGFQQFDTAGEMDSEDEIPTINGDGPMDSGTVLEGTVVDIYEGESDDGPWWRLRLNEKTRGVLHYFAKGDVKIALQRDAVAVGDDVWIAKMTEEDSFTGSDGEEVTYYPTEFAVKGDS